jgi:hypothetical protein
MRCHDVPLAAAKKRVINSYASGMRHFAEATTVRKGLLILGIVADNGESQKNSLRDLS